MPGADGLTDGLEHLKLSINKRFPNRDKTSDGTWGDAAHKLETSGHNADDTAGSKAEWNGDPDNIPEVRAEDIDSDLRDPEVNAQQLVDHVRKLPGIADVLRYIIYWEKMYHERDHFEPTDYNGKNKHHEHIHFSGAFSQAADNNKTFDYKLDELGDNMPTVDDIWNADVVTNPKQRTDSPLHTPKGTNVDTSVKYAIGDIWRIVENLSDTVTAIAADVKSLKEGK
jgi:hypothetical protein